MKHQILFVDDEPHLLQGLQRMLRPMRQEWDMQFADSGPQALELMDQHLFDVIVSDMRMPGMDGAELLTQVRQRHPVAVRLILSGHSDLNMILRAVGPTHQFLAKPCEPDTIKTAVSRACTLRTLLPDPSLTQIVTGIETLPSIPARYDQVVEAAQTPESSLTTIGQVIASDLSMTAKTLQLAQSAFFGLQRQLSATQAINVLGFDTVQALVLTAQIFSYADATTMDEFFLERLWDHSMAVGTCARRIMQHELSDPDSLDETFMAGILHDVGSLILATHLPEVYTEVRMEADATETPIWQVEQALLGATHAEIGAYLMGLWGLPEPVVEAIAYHHQPATARARDLSPLAAVHVAESFVQNIAPVNSRRHAYQIDSAYLQQLGLLDRLPVWQEQCQLALQELSAQRQPGSFSYA